MNRFHVSLVLLFHLNLPAMAQQPPTLPLPEMQRLSKMYVGTWTYTETYANGAKNTGVYTSELGPGGNSIINRFHSKGPAGESEGVLVMTWEAKDQAYKCYVLGGDFPGALVESGQWDGATLVFRGELVSGPVKVAMRNTATLRADGTLIGETFSSANGAPEKRLVHVEAVRK